MLGGGKDIRPRSGRMGHGIHGTGKAMVGKIRRNSPFIAPRLKRQDRLFNRGLSDQPHGGTIMREQIAKLNIEEKLIACIEMAQKRQDDIRALRAENARLRGLLAEIQYDCEHIGGIQHLDKAERRTWVSVANRIKDALQPERGTK